MSTDTAELTKVDSAVSGLSSSPPDKKGHRRASSSAAGVFNINDLGKLKLRRPVASIHLLSVATVSSPFTADMDAEKEGKELQIAPETQKLNW